MLDEQALRKPAFSEGPKIKLGDGQEWTFPRPWTRVFPRVIDSGEVVMGLGSSFGEEHDDDLDTLLFSPAYEERTMVAITMATKLLLRNYNLDNRALRQLLMYDVESEESARYWNEIIPVLTGTNVPKPLADGSD